MLTGESHTVVKAGGIFLLPRIFPSYFMKILQQIFRKNGLHNISWHFNESNSNFTELPHSMIYDERFRDLLGRLSAAILMHFLFNTYNTILWSSGYGTHYPRRRMEEIILPTIIFFFSAIIPRNIPKYISNKLFWNFSSYITSGHLHCEVYLGK